MSAVTGTTDIDPCPYCGATSGVQGQPAPPKVQAWSCSVCNTQWAITVANPYLRCAYPADLVAVAEEIDRLRWWLRQVIALADDAPQLADVQLRDRLLVLADRADCAVSGSR